MVADYLMVFFISKSRAHQHHGKHKPACRKTIDRWFSYNGITTLPLPLQHATVAQPNIIE